ncbi:Type I Iterative PKS [Bacidia gigantensis]|uniref:Type I Iterative PKS n=1 Tax=Bacidia gigantensis TaxID=2732470 RepID=UPI001D057683|nr:Type I Iterative PKS [Bacidia gigantensis]KAG8527863.1 Type I Iterative PKS [Bacidia gigantensis]
MDTPSSSSSEGINDFTSKLVYFSNEFPNDDLQDLFRRLQRNSKDRRFRQLSIFLDEATTVVKEEALKLPQAQQDLLPQFSSVLQLVDNGEFRQGPLGGALESALLCVLEIGMFIAHHESNNLSLDLPKTSTTLSGLSIGLFAAAAVSVSSSLPELALTGAESVRVAFRLGVHVEGVSQSLEPRPADGNSDSWAYVVTGVSAEEAQSELDQFNAESVSRFVPPNSDVTNVFPSLTLSSLSASDKNSVSITGPPSRLKNAFRHSQLLRYSKHMPLPVYNGLCHAPHVYSEEDISAIVKGSEPKCSTTRKIQLPLFSPETGKPYPAQDAGSLFEQICTEILTGTIYLDNLTNGVLKDVSSTGRPECLVYLFRVSLIAKSFLSVIESELSHVTVVKYDLIDWAFKQPATAIPRSPKQSKLAIVGYSCRLPGGADDNELFWQLLKEGRDVHSEVPADRFDLSTHYDPTGKTPNATQTPFGNFINQPGLFDAGFFNMSPKEAEQTDPMHRLALVTAYEALEMSGYAPNRTPSTNLKRVGTFYGQASDDWRELNGGQNIGTYAVPGGERAFANGRINYFFKFGGPSFNIDTACSSGLAAVNSACSALWSGEADTVLAGGLSVITNPDNYCMLSQGHFLSKTGQCKVWDKGADGYCRADGIGSVVIKRLEDAEADNDNIIATVCSAFTNHSADALSITQPHAGAQRENYTQVMQDAGVNPLDVSYVELHGTGTQVGDAIESESVSDVFAPLVPRRRADQRLHLGAVKSNIGHAEAAAGIASLLKVLLVYQKGEIPPHVGIKSEFNPILPKDLDKRNVGLNLELVPRPRIPGKNRYTIVNSFGAHGGNTTMLLEDAPEKIKSGEDLRPNFPVAISAKSKIALKSNVEAMISYLDQNPEIDIGDLSYTTCARRIHHNFRLATSVAGTAQLRKFLETSVEKAGNLRPVGAPPVAFAFTGQGAFYKGIGSQLYKDFPAFRTQVQQLDQLVQQFGFPSITTAVEGSVGDGVSPLVTQLTIVVIEIALARFWALFGITPSAVIGHSLGEYAAMVVAGVMSAADAIFLVGKRAELVLASAEIGSHIMLSVRASVKNIKEAAGQNKSYEVSCINGPDDTVISGLRSDIQATRASLEAKGHKCMELDVPFAFHTAQMDPVLEPFEQIAKHVAFKAPSVPILSPLLCDAIFDDKTVNASYLCRATRETVDFVAALEAGEDLGIIEDKTLWVDIGPHPICGSFIRSCVKDARVIPSLRKNEENWASVTSSLAALHSEGLSICWNEYFRDTERAHTLLELPKYQWNEKDYWIQYEGTWTLDKAFPHGSSNKASLSAFGASGSSLRTSSIHQVISEELQDTTGTLIAISDLMHPDLLAAVWGHKMNDNGVATSSIWADMAATVAEHLYKSVQRKAKDVYLDVAEMEVLHAQIAQKDTSSAQLIQLEATIDLGAQATQIYWYTIDAEGSRSEAHFASATVRYSSPKKWHTEWDRVSHLVQGRIESLSRMAAEGEANRLNKNMAYTLFKNVVDYTEKYRGMQSVVLNDHEAYADITLFPERHGKWHTPPHWIDSVCHLGGLILNGSDAQNTKDFFYVTPGWDSFRLSKPLEAGGKYRSYVKMFETGETNMYAGDVYILQDETVIGMMGQMTFRKVNRVLMNQFFSAPDAGKKASSGAAGEAAPKPKAAVPKPAQKKEEAPAAPPAEKTKPLPEPKQAKEEPKPAAAAAAAPAKASVEDNIIGDALKLIARETGLEAEELTDDASFVELGVDSLMSLVLSEKFKSELQVEVKSSLFIECPSIGEMKGWLEQFC